MSYEPNYEITLTCRECRVTPANTIDDYTTGDTICTDCGLILDSHLVDSRPEWRTFNNDDDTGPDPNRCGDAASLLLHGSQLTTAISYGTGKAGHTLSRAAKAVKAVDGNKALIEAYAKIEAMSAGVGLVKMVVETAKGLYKRAYDSGKVKGRKQEAVIAGCLFLACRQCKLARTFTEVMAITTVPKKELGRTFKVLERLFSEEDVKKGQREVEGTGGSTVGMIVRLCDALALSFRARRMAEEMAVKVAERGVLGGRSPVTLAGVVVYMVSALVEDPKTTREIAAIVGCSPLTMRAAYKELWKQRETLVDPEWNVNIRRMPRPN